MRVGQLIVMMQGSCRRMVTGLLVAAATLVSTCTFSAPTVSAAGVLAAVAPDAPGGLQVTGLTSGSVTLSWDAPQFGPTPHGYLVRAYSATTAERTVCETISALTCTAKGLQNNVTYTFSVVAYNNVDWTYSDNAVTATPFNPPTVTAASGGCSGGVTDSQICMSISTGAFDPTGVRSSTVSWVNAPSSMGATSQTYAGTNRYQAGQENVVSNITLMNYTTPTLTAGFVNVGPTLQLKPGVGTLNLLKNAPCYITDGWSLLGSGVSRSASVQSRGTSDLSPSYDCPYSSTLGTNYYDAAGTVLDTSSTIVTSPFAIQAVVTPSTTTNGSVCDSGATSATLTNAGFVAGVQKSTTTNAAWIGVDSTCKPVFCAIIATSGAVGTTQQCAQASTADTLSAPTCSFLCGASAMLVTGVFVPSQGLYVYWRRITNGVATSTNYAGSYLCTTTCAAIKVDSYVSAAGYLSAGAPRTGATTYTTTRAFKGRVKDVAIFDLTTPTMPGAPTITAVTPVDYAAAVYVTPGTTGTTANANIIAQCDSATGTTGVGSTTASGSSAVVVYVLGLTPQASYTCRAWTNSSNGLSVASAASSTGTPYGVPADANQSLSTVTSLACTAASSSTAACTWTAPTQNGGSAITGYEYTYSSDDGATWLTTTATGSTAASKTITGLATGTNYYIKVRPKNVAGAGGWAEIGPLSTEAPPNAPTSITASPTTSQTVQVGFFEPTGGVSPVLDYDVEYSTSASTAAGSGTLFEGGTTPSGTTTINVTGLTNGTAYYFRVRATSAAGDSSWSSPISSAATPYTTPDTPTGVTCTPSNQQLACVWSPSASNGSSITGYKYRISSNSGTTWSTATSTLSASTASTITGLTNGTAYIVQVLATNAAGDSAYSSSSASATPTTTADAPTSVTCTPGNNQLGCSWTAPSITGGSTIISYSYKVSFNNGTTWSATTSTGTTTTSATLTGLTNGTAYVVQVLATNTAGDSAYSASSLAATPYGVSTAPTAVACAAGDTELVCNWTSPSSENGSAVTGYKVRTSSDAGSTWGSPQTSGTSTSTTISGLTNGTAYVVQVLATNAAGDSAYSASSLATTPVGTPTTPTAVTCTPSNTQIACSWTAPTSNGGSVVTAYKYRVSTNSGTTWSSAASTLSALTSTTITGLTNGTAYMVQVLATNTVGDSAYSASSLAATPYTTPDAPTGVTCTPGDTQIACSWTAPTSNGGSVVTAYKYRVSTNSGTTWSSAASTLSALTSTTITGLTNGTAYMVQVLATNAAGDSSYSSASATATPFTVANPPNGVGCTPGDTQIVCSWTAPAFNGGSVVTGYKYRISADSGTTWSTVTSTLSTATTKTLTGLTNGTAYIVQLSATNAAGDSAYSTSSTPQIPYGTPSAPTGVSCTPGDTQLDCSWTAPASNGGSAVTGYKYRISADSGTTWSTATSTLSTATTKTLTGLTNGTAYIVQVLATNTAGDSPYSTSSSAQTPFTTPSAPSGVSAARAASETVRVSFTAGSNGGSAVTDFDVEYSTSASTPAGSGSFFEGGTTTASFVDVDGLTNGTAYFFRTRATNAAGNSAWSTPISAAATPYTTPDTPTQVVGTPGMGQVTVSWTTPAASGGSTITNYRVTVFDEFGNAPTDVTGLTARVTNQTATSYVFIGLTAAVAYTFSVEAYNTAGWSNTSALSAPVTPYAAPSAPTDASCITGDTQLVCTWTAPASTGGSALSAYKYRFSTNNGTTWSTAASTLSTTTGTTITGLTNGTTYIIQVSASNVAGDSAYSASSAPVTPYTTADGPTGVSCTPGDTQMVCSWTAPASNGGSVVTGYKYRVSADSGTTWSTATATLSTATTKTVSGLTNGTSYLIQVAALNAAGESIYSWSSTPTTPFETPSAPTDVTCSPADTQLVCAWAAPNSTGGSAITTYKYRVSSNSGTTWATTTSTGSTTAAKTVSGLTNGTSYVVQVLATNAAGDSPWSLASTATAPYGAPSAPSGVSAARAASETVRVSFTPGSNGGSAVTDFDVEYSTSSQTLAGSGTFFEGDTTTASFVDVTGLTNGTAYFFRTRATNAAGNSAWSTPISAATPYTTPDTPTQVVGTPGMSQVTVSWTTPATNGGSTITSYRVTVFDEFGNAPTDVTGLTTRVVTQTATSYVFTGLTPAVAYTFSVEAYNTAGWSNTSTLSTPVTPYAAPSAPSSVTATRFGSGAITVTITPGSSSGTPITDFDIEYSTNPTFAAGNGVFVEGGTSTSVAQLVSGLNNGTAYYFRARQTTLVGDSAWSTVSNSATPYTTPSAPSSLAVTAGDQQVEVSWATPNANGSALIEYKVTALDASGNSLGGVVGTDIRPTGSTSTLFVFSQLTLGTTYTFKVEARNAAGWGPQSVLSSPATPLSSPDTVTPVTLSSSTVRTITVHWNAPASVVTTYTVQRSTDSGTSWGSDVTVSSALTSYTASALTEGVTYRFKVRANNTAGFGQWAQSVDMTLVHTPTAATNVAATPGNTTVAIVWSAPVSSAASPIDAYSVWVNGAEIATTTSTTYTVSSLTNGTTYSFQIGAENGAGTSPLTATIRSTPRTTPSAPSTLAVAPYGPRTLRATWTAPASTGGAAISSYQAEYSQDGNTWTPATVSGLSATASALTAGTGYLWHVVAINAAGLGLFATTTVETTAVDIPPTPSTAGITASARTLSVTWPVETIDITAPVTSIEVWIGGTLRCSASYSTGACAVSALNGGVSYTLSVRAVGPAGSSTSYSLTGTPLSQLPTPAQPKLSMRSGQLTLSFTYNPVGLVTPSVQAQLSTDNGVTWQDAPLISEGSPVTLTAIEYGVRHVSRVRVITNTAVGQWSVASKPVIPVGAPTVPELTTSSASDKRVTLRFSILSTGGLPVVRYEVQQSADGGLTYTPGATDLRIPTTVTSLRNGTQYVFRTRAWNAVGPSAWSAPTSTLRPYDTVVAPMTGVISEDSALRVVWSPQLDTASRTITGYRVYMDTTVVCSTQPEVRSCEVPNLPNNTAASVHVVAVASDLDKLERVGEKSLPAKGTPRAATVQAAVPLNAPGGLRVTPLDEELNVAFNPAPAARGTQVPSGHRVYVDGQLGCQIPGKNYACTVIGVQNNQPYTITVVPYYDDLEGAPSSAVTATPIAWSSTAPLQTVSQNAGADIRITVNRPNSVGVTGYQWSRDGVVIATTTNLVTTFLDKDRNTIAGSYTYQVNATGGHNRLSDPASVTVNVDAVATPALTGTSPTRGTVVLTAQAATSPPAGSTWIVYRNGLPLRTAPVADTSQPQMEIVLAFQPRGRFTYTVRLATPNGTSALSAPIDVAVRAF